MLEDTMWAICDEYTWALPAHMNGNQGIYVNYQSDRYTIDLFAAETGQALAEIIRLLGDKLNPLVVKRAKEEIGVHSIRGGGMIGEHTLYFLNDAECLSITHTAFSRDVFGIGALHAVKFLVNKKPGLYEMKNLFE